MKTFKTIIKEEQVVDVTICNNCGNVCDNNEPISIKAEGSFNSKHLIDCAYYEFDLCEKCLIKIMDGLKIPPVVMSDTGAIEYTNERKRNEDQIAISYFQEVAYKNAIAVCPCYDCLNKPELGFLNTANTRMILCKTCGNKRCPHAANHNNKCTNSNEPGQTGSRY